MHYAIHKLHWPPSKILEWLDCGQKMQSFYYGSLELKIEHDKKEQEKMKRKAPRAKGGRRR